LLKPSVPSSNPGCISIIRRLTSPSRAACPRHANHQRAHGVL
jgi:hypothetical protein